LFRCDIYYLKSALIYIFLLRNIILYKREYVFIPISVVHQLVFFLFNGYLRICNIMLLVKAKYIDRVWDRDPSGDDMC
jgi:hypothetical protein